MTCEDLELRLYDEDCRRALLGEAAVPRDVADHLAGCVACREAWTGAARDTLRLTHDLPLTQPPSLTERVVSSATRTAPKPAMGWFDAGTALATGALLAAATALIPGAGPLWQWAAFWTGAAGGFAASIIDQNIPLPTLILPG